MVGGWREFFGETTCVDIIRCRHWWQRLLDRVIRHQSNIVMHQLKLQKRDAANKTSSYCNNQAKSPFLL